MKRPPPTIRIAVLVAAIACLGLAMCTHDRGRTTTPANESQATPVARQAPPPDAARAAPPPEYFPATKAPPQLYQQAP
ncbi:MAG TPA: hypothetical protein VLX92_29060 [Kofleriaceae bacterium]|nr:hypothetical protein [Kofleriaceae bacterium]